MQPYNHDCKVTEVQLACNSPRHKEVSSNKLLQRYKCPAIREGKIISNGVDKSFERLYLLYSEQLRLDILFKEMSFTWRDRILIQIRK